jgi:hypothetical protein
MNMNIVYQVGKEILVLILTLFSLGLILKIFLKHTLLGKIITVTIIDILLFIKLCLKIIKTTGKFSYRVGKKINRKLVGNLKKSNINEIKSTGKKKVADKVVNSNVIDFKSAKQLRYKWHK